MKVKELVEILQSCDQEVEVILQKDSEGNGYSPLAGGEGAVYEAETTYSGTVYSEQDLKDGYGKAFQPCVVLYPIN